MKISLLEDEKILAKAIKRKLSGHGYNTSIYNSLSDFKNKFSSGFRLYLIDLSLTDGSGYDIINWLKNHKKINSPIIVISGFKSHEYKIKALNMGADDYMCKPIIPDELVARVSSLIRRTNRTEKDKSNSVLKYKKIEFDLVNKITKKNGKKIELGKKESQLCELFLLNIGRLLSKDYIIENIWGDSANVRDNTVNVTVCRLRKLLGKNFKLLTHHGAGYTLE